MAQVELEPLLEGTMNRWVASAPVLRRRSGDDEDDEFDIDDFEEDDEFEDEELDEDEFDDEELDEDYDEDYDELDEEFDDDGEPRRGGGGRPRREWE